MVSAGKGFVVETSLLPAHRVPATVGGRALPLVCRDDFTNSRPELQELCDGTSSEKLRLPVRSWESRHCDFSLCAVLGLRGLLPAGKVCASLDFAF